MSDGKTADARPIAEGPCARIGAELDTLLRTLCVSSEAAQHFTNARVEMLKGVRAIIDRRIERLSREDQKGVSVPIE